MTILACVGCLIVGIVIGMAIMYYNLSGYVNKELDELM